MVPAERIAVSRAALAGALAFAFLGGAMVLLGRRDYPNLHLVLDASTALLSGVLAMLFLDLARRVQHPLPRWLAITFGVTSALELVHVLVTVEWFGALAPIAAAADSLRPGTWPPSAHILPLGIAVATILLRRGVTRTTEFAVGAVGISLGLVVFFNALPRYAAPGFLGITRPTLVLVPVLWTFAAVSAWRVRDNYRLTQVLAIVSASMAVATLPMLYSTSPHDTEAIVTHLGKFGAYLILLRALLQFATSDMAALGDAQRALAESNQELEARVQRRTDALAASETRFRSLIENSADGIALLSPDGKLVYRSSAANRLIGASDDEALGGAFDRIHPDDAPAMRDLLASALADPTLVRQATVRVRHASGDWRVFEVSLSNLVTNPHVGALVINFRDVTDRVRAEEIARERTERFQEMADHIREAYFVVEIATNTILYISPTWAEIWGRPLEEGYNSSIWFNAVHPEDRDIVSKSQAEVFAGRANEVVFRVVRPDGVKRWVRGRVYPVRNSAGVVHRFVGVSEDITELRQAEERFTQSQKMEAIGRLAGGVAHDFNNLLTVIIAEADLVQSCLPPDSELIQWLKEIRSASDSAVGLTRQLLAFSRKQLIEPVVFELNDVVTDTGKMLRRLIGEDVRLEIKLGPVGSVRADRGQIEQVLTNLAVNARDAMPDGGALIIETTQMTLDEEYVRDRPEIPTGVYAVMIVSDTGSGMTEEVRRHAFEPFFTTKDLGKGTGLGLATCHGIVKQAGGHITIYSEIGMGTTFRVFLPCVENSAVVTLAAAASAAQRGSETILMVEDEPGVRRVGVRILTSLGYTVLEARDAVEALRLIATHSDRIDLLFSDVVLPGMGGRELADRVRIARPEIKVLYTSGYTDDVILQHQLIAHDVTVLQKPYTQLTVAQKVRAVLDG